MATTWEQTTYRFRNDDGSESAASWIDAAGTNITITPTTSNTKFRIRIAAKQTGTTSATLTGRLYISKNGGTYAQASSSSTTGCKVVASANLTDDSSTTQQLSSGTFVAGKVDDSTGQCSATGTIAQNSVTDHEYMLQIDYANVVNGDYFDFRERNSTTAFGTYTLTGRVTISKSVATIAPVGTPVSAYANNVTKNGVTAGNIAIFGAADAAGADPTSNPPVSSGSASTGTWNLAAYYDGGGDVSCVWWAPITGGGNLTVTFSYWNTDIGVSLHEYSGILTTTPARQSGHATGTSNNPSATISAALNKSLIFGVIQSEASPYEALTATSPFTKQTEQVSHHHATLDYVATADGDRAVAGTWASSKYWVVNAVEFLPGPTTGAYTLAATTGSFTETGQNLTALKVSRYLGASMRTYALTGQNLTALKVGRYLGATMRTYTLTGQSLSALLAKRMLTATTQTYTLTYKNLSALLAKRILTAMQQSYTLTRNNAGLLAGRKISATMRTYVVTFENLTSLLLARRLSAAFQSYTMTGENVTLTYSGSGLHYYTLTVLPGSYSLQGISSNLRASRRVVVTAGSFIETGENATLRAARLLTAVTQTFSWTGYPISLSILGGWVSNWYTQARRYDMIQARKKSSTTYPITFFMVDSANHYSGKTGLSPTVTLSKNGISFVGANGAVSEIGNGWYALAGNAADRGTLGTVAMHAAAAGADACDIQVQIVDYDPFLFGTDLNDSILDVDFVVNAIAVDTRTTLPELINTRTTLEPGAFPLVVHREDNFGANLPDVVVWVTNDAEGRNVIAKGITNLNGDVTFYLDEGNCYIWSSKSGYSFENPVVKEVVSV